MRFEGETVDESRVVLRQFKSEWPVDHPLLADETVELRVKAWVREVSHEINEKTGNMSRTHVLYVREVDPV